MPGLYIHIPFCLSKCAYCDFYSRDDMLYAADDYIAALSAELCYYKDKFAPSYKTLYIGGGTPTSFSVKHIDSLFTRIFWTADRKKMGEITIEANPETITEKTAKALAVNVNRVSLGCQSFDDDMLKKLGRIHGSAAVFKSVKILKDSGIKNINLDLMFGLPGQDEDSAMADLKTAAKISPQHISWYMLTPHDSESFRRMAEAGGGLPADEITAKMYEKGVKFLEAAGYRQYEISNFSRPGSECRHNLNYWEMGEYIGTGASASSFFKGSRYTNAGSIEEYIRRLKANSDPAEFSEEMTRENMQKEHIMLSLRLKNGLSFREFRDRFGFDFKERYSNIISKFTQSGLMETDAASARLTVKGFLVSNTVIGGFFPG